MFVVSIEEFDTLMRKNAEVRANEALARIIKRHPYSSVISGKGFTEEVYTQLGLCYLQAVLDVFTEVSTQELAMGISGQDLPKN